MDPCSYPLVILLFMTFCAQVIYMGNPEEAALWKNTWDATSTFNSAGYLSNLTSRDKISTCARLLNLHDTEIQWADGIKKVLLAFSEHEQFRVDYYLSCRSIANTQNVKFCSFRRTYIESNEVEFVEIYYQGEHVSEEDLLVFTLFPSGGEGLSRFFPE